MLHLPLTGWKTYGVALAMLAYAGCGYALGYLDAVQAGQLALQALAVAGLRHGIATTAADSVSPARLGSVAGKSTKILALLWAWSAAANALAATPEEASYRIDVRQPGGEICGGSCTFIRPYVCVTNAHVVGSGETALVRHQSGVRIEGRVAARSPADLALVVVAEPQPFVELAERDPQRGDKLHMVGYGGDRKQRAGDGVSLGCDGLIHGGVRTYTTTVQSVSGDSGGGLFLDGRLIAINWGADARSASASIGVESLKRFGEQWATNALPQERWQEMSCFGGRCGPCQPLVGPPVSGPFAGGGEIGIGLGIGIKRPPLLPPVTSPPSAGENDKKLAELSAQLKALDDKLSTLKPVPGPPGPAGPPGKDGSPGPPGKEADLDALAAAVLRRLPPIQVQTYDYQNNPIDHETYPLGTPIRLRYGIPAK